MPACARLGYRDVPIEPGSVAYCDIPYDTKDGKGIYRTERLFWNGREAKE